MWKRLVVLVVLPLVSLLIAPSIADVITGGNAAEIGRLIFTVALLLLANLYIFVRQHN